MADIRIFVCCHEPSYVLKHLLLAPVQVSAALANERFAHDGEGENTSAQMEAAASRQAGIDVEECDGRAVYKHISKYKSTIRVPKCLQTELLDYAARNEMKSERYTERTAANRCSAAVW